MMHIVHLMANNASVPYFNWFAEEIHHHPEFKYSFIALYPTKPQMLADMEARGCDCYWIEFDSARRKSSMLMALPKLVQLFRKIKVDAVNTHLFDDSLPGLLAARLAGIKKRVITKNDTTFHWNYAPKWVWADRFNNFNATDIVAISRESMHFIVEQEGADSQKVSLVHHGIELKTSTHQKEEYKMELMQRFNLNNRIVIGTIARLIDWKGYKYIIEAARDLVKRFPSITFLFTGEGPQALELRLLVEQYQLSDHVIFTGWVDRAYIPSLYGIMDIYLHAAVKEPFGFVIAEAMANGIPLVTTATGAAADALKHKENCFFLRQRSSEDIVEGISWTLSDQVLRSSRFRQLAEIAHDMYDVKDMVKKYLEVYKKPTNL